MSIKYCVDMPDLFVTKILVIKETDKTVTVIDGFSGEAIQINKNTSSKIIVDNLEEVAKIRTEMIASRMKRLSGELRFYSEMLNDLHRFKDLVEAY